MKLLLADDHSLFKEALAQYIERAEPDAEIIQARDLHEVMEILEGGSVPDLVLLDLRMPGMYGVKGIEKIRNMYPDLPLALMSGIAEKHDVDAALELGVNGYFPKTLPGKLFVKGIKQVLAGEKYIPYNHNTGEMLPAYYSDDIYGQVAEKQTVSGMSDLSQQAFNSKGEMVRLTPRERDVLAFLLKGESNKEIARALDLQVVTIKLHVRGICRKLGAKNRTQAALIGKEISILG